MFTTCDMDMSPEEKNEQEWKEVLAPESHKQSYINLLDFISEERKTYTVYPPPEDVFSWMRACSPYDVKVVILGQDPYTKPNQAHGLAFSILPEPDLCEDQFSQGIKARYIPPSLKGIYKELEKTIPGFVRPNHGYLLGWAQQGVLLLNTVLTVRHDAALSHEYKGWEQFIDAVISVLNEKASDLVFMLWGAYAQRKEVLISNDNHYVLTTSHPSPRSAHLGFDGCNHFLKCNQYLMSPRKTLTNSQVVPKTPKTPILWVLDNIP